MTGFCIDEPKVDFLFIVDVAPMKRRLQRNAVNRDEMGKTRICKYAFMRIIAENIGGVSRCKNSNPSLRR